MVWDGGVTARLGPWPREFSGRRYVQGDRDLGVNLDRGTQVSILIESIGNLLLSFEIFNSHGRDFEIY